jgi:hypothetical protein
VAHRRGLAHAPRGEGSCARPPPGWTSARSWTGARASGCGCRSVDVAVEGLAAGRRDGEPGCAAGAVPVLSDLYVAVLGQHGHLLGEIGCAEVEVLAEERELHPLGGIEHRHDAEPPRGAQHVVEVGQGHRCVRHRATIPEPVATAASSTPTRSQETCETRRTMMFDATSRATQRGRSRRQSEPASHGALARLPRRIQTTQATTNPVHAIGAMTRCRSLSIEYVPKKDKDRHGEDWKGPLPSRQGLALVARFPICQVLTFADARSVSPRGAPPPDPSPVGSLALARPGALR